MSFFEDLLKLEEEEEKKEERKEVKKERKRRKKKETIGYPMGIQEGILKNILEKLENLSAAVNRLTEILEKSGLGKTLDERILEILYRSEPRGWRTNDIAIILGIDKVHILKLLRKLQERGIIRKDKNARWHLTRSGLMKFTQDENEIESILRNQPQ